MEIIEKNITDLKEYENNPRNNDGAVAAVAESIAEFGFKVPIVIDGDGVIVAGHTRKKAAERLGLESVPCIVADDLTPAKVAAFRLADNKTAELATWDLEALQAEINALTAFDVDMSAFGFDEVIFDEGFTTDFELPTDDKPQTRTITLSLAEEQYQICESVIDFSKDKIAHDFGNSNKRSNALFEAVYEWAEQKSLL